MPDVLPRLLKSYEFLRGALEAHGARMTPADARRLEAERDKTFDEIVTHRARDARVTVAQLRFLMTNLSGLTRDADGVRLLEATCVRHLESIATAVAAGSNPTAEGMALPRFRREHVHLKALLAPDNLRLLDMMSDRIGILDRDYRYVFCNAANARFHGTEAGSFVGRCNPDLVGSAFFERVSRSRLEQCFAGEKVSFVSQTPFRTTLQPYSVTFDPVCDEQGKVVATMIVARDISHIPVPTQLILSADGAPLP